jgi:hypothetical protein
LTIQLNFKIQVTKEEMARNIQRTGFLDKIQTGLQEAMKAEFEILRNNGRNRFLHDNRNNDTGEEEAYTKAEQETYETLVQHERRKMAFVRDDHLPTFDAVVQNRESFTLFTIVVVFTLVCHFFD